MEKLKSNIIYKSVANFIQFIESLITSSGIYSLLTKEVTRKKDSFFENILYKIIDFLRMIFNKLRLNKVFEGSIFAKTEIFIGFAIILAPILPTMLDLVVVIGVIISFFLKIMLDEKFKFVYSPVNLFLNLFLIIYFISSLISYDINTSLNIGMLLLCFMLFYYVIINSIKAKTQIRVMIALFTAVGLLISCYGGYQYVFGGSFASSSFVDKELFEDITTRVSGTFDNPNVLGEYLLLIIPMCGAYFFSLEGFRKKLFSLVALGIVGVCLLLTYSRGCYLGVIIEATIFLLLINIRFILLFIAGAISLPFVLPKSIMNRFTSIGNTEDSSTSYRISIWKGAIAMIKDHWYRPIGQGTKAFNHIYPFYALNGVGAEHTHNLLLQIAVETSLFGLGAFLITIFRVFQSLLAGIKLTKDMEMKCFLIAFVSGLSGFMVQSVFDNTWYNNRIVLVFWIFIALAISLKNIARKEENIGKD